MKRLIYSSSASVYGNAKVVPMTEDHPLDNCNFYGATKISGEAMCRAFYDRYGLDFVGLRYMNVYGVNQDQQAAYSGFIPAMLNQLMHRRLQLLTETVGKLMILSMFGMLPAATSPR